MISCLSGMASLRSFREYAEETHAQWLHRLDKLFAVLCGGRIGVVQLVPLEKLSFCLAVVSQVC